MAETSGYVSNLDSERYIYLVYIMNPESNNIHANISMSIYSSFYVYKLVDLFNHTDLINSCSFISGKSVLLSRTHKHMGNYVVFYFSQI